MDLEIRERRGRYSVTRLAASIAVLGIFVFIDQFVKAFIMTHLKNMDFPLIGRFVYFSYAENTGAAFSMLEGMRWLLVGLPLLMVLFCLVLIFSQAIRPAAVNLSLLLISAGGIGNLIDRIRYGYVVDYISPRFVRFAIFNIADVFVVCGAVLFCLYLMIHESTLARRRK